MLDWLLRLCTCLVPTRLGPDSALGNLSPREFAALAPKEDCPASSHYAWYRKWGKTTIILGNPNGAH